MLDNYPPTRPLKNNINCKLYLMGIMNIVTMNLTLEAE